MQQLVKISQQTFWQILGKIVTAASTFIILGMVARNFGEAGTGVFTLALTYLAMFYLLSDFGFNAHVLKKVAGNSGPPEGRVTGEWQKLLGTRLVWSVILVILAVGLLPFWPFTSSQFSAAVSFGVLAIIGYSVFVTCNLIFQSRLRYDLSVLSVSFGTVISLGLFIYLLLNFYPVPFLLLAHLSGWILIAASALFLVKGGLPIFDKRYAINLFKDTWPIAATLALNVVYFRADSFMIAIFKGVSDVGIYNMAYSVFQSALVLPTFIMNAYYPLMLRSQKGIKIVGLGLLGLASLGTILTLIISPVVIKVLTGGGFAGSIAALQILSLGFPAYFLSSLLMWVMVVRGRYKLMMAIYGFGLVINLTLNFIYIPGYSFLAASWITVFCEYLILGMQAVVLLSERKLRAI